MTTVVQVTCYQTRSLREAIVSDRRLRQYGLEVSRQHTPGRNPGWAKLYGSDYTTRGSINIEWDLQTRTLLARIVNRSSGKPDEITGRFVKYLLARHRRNIRSILISPDV